ncbi:hypothetical protein P7K49_037805 [Saguinus oedipus]|uniref:RRM domain-containing protein n=1 Tax=Saguinus oedipus TaxID=9490 RepID=A0ABQ9TKR1_SAGOE|nr:hypothetical protein P7K49_037805 [Saguinus oedipus]
MENQEKFGEIAKAELNDTPRRGRQLRVCFATPAAALSVPNLSTYISNELLAFSQFGPIERAAVIVGDRGRSTGKGIVEFASKPAAIKAFERCSEGVFLLTTTPGPVIGEPLEQLMKTVFLKDLPRRIRCIKGREKPLLILPSMAHLSTSILSDGSLWMKWKNSKGNKLKKNM